jgi:hypothetical protein
MTEKKARLFLAITQIFSFSVIHLLANSGATTISGVFASSTFWYPVP